MALGRSRRKVLIFIIPELHHGGAERVLFDIVSNLDENVFEINIVAFVKRPDSPFHFNPSIKLHNLFSKTQPLKPRNIFKKKILIVNILYRLNKLLRKFPGDAAVIPFLARPTACYTVLAQLFSKRRIIASLHTTESTYMKFNYQNTFKKALEQLMLKIACRGADNMIAVSAGVTTDLVQNFSIPAENICVIANPLNLKKIERLKSEPVEISDIVGSNRTVFVNIGRLSVEKNHKLLIQAGTILKNSKLDFVILIAGAGDQEMNIRRWIQDAGLQDRIIMLGPVNNPFALMARARALILTSHYDSSPMVLKEAMASGTAVISVDCPQGPADITQNGKYGILLPPNNPQALADAMIAIAKNDKVFKKLVREGKKHAVNFDIGTIIPQWEKVFLQAQ